MNLRYLSALPISAPKKVTKPAGSQKLHHLQNQTLSETFIPLKGPPMVLSPDSLDEYTPSPPFYMQELADEVEYAPERLTHSHMIRTLEIVSQGQRKATKERAGGSTKGLAALNVKSDGLLEESEGDEDFVGGSESESD